MARRAVQLARCDGRKRLKRRRRQREPEEKGKGCQKLTKGNYGNLGDEGANLGLEGDVALGVDSVANVRAAEAVELREKKVSNGTAKAGGEGENEPD